MFFIVTDYTSYYCGIENDCFNSHSNVKMIDTCSYRWDDGRKWNSFFEMILSWWMWDCMVTDESCINGYSFLWEEHRSWKTASFTSYNIILGTFCAACYTIHLIIIALLNDNTYWLIIYTVCNLRIPKRTIKTGGKFCTVAHYCNLWNQINLLISDLQQNRITSWQCYDSTNQCYL